MCPTRRASARSARIRRAPVEEGENVLEEEDDEDEEDAPAAPRSAPEGFRVVD